MKKTSKNIPISKGIKTEWNLKAIYNSLEDSQIEKDITLTEKAYTNFANKYGNSTDYLKGGPELLEALKDWEKLAIAPADRIIRYLHCVTDTDASNSKAQALNNVMMDRITKASNKVLFFELNLAKISKEVQNKIIKNPDFSRFQYYLEIIFKNAQHNLSEAEEKIISLKSSPSHRMWVSAQSKYLSSQTIAFKGKDISIAEAIDLRVNLPKKERYALHKKIVDRCREISFFAEAEFAAIVNNKKTSDELRGFENPEDATILHYQNDKKSVDNLVEVTTKYFNVSQRFYRLKARLMKEKNITLADIAVSIGKDVKKVSFNESVELIREAFTKADRQFTDIFDSMLSNGQIDVFPKKGKRGGAYCGWSHNAPTMILMNHVDSMRSVETLAHEMGHAIHGELSKKQPVLYEDCTISVAEVASTFFENIIFDYVFPNLPEREKIYSLFSHIQDDISTVFRQIAFYNFEKDLHADIRKKGALSKEEIAALYSKHLKSYLGDAVKFDENDGYGYVYVPHFRTFFYVYSYAYGQLISKALYEKYKKNPLFIKDIKRFMEAGGSMSPEKIFKSIGVDTSKPEFFEEGIKSIEEDINRLEKLAKEAKMI